MILSIGKANNMGKCRRILWRFLSLPLLLLTLTGLLAACGDKQAADTSTLSLEEDGKLTQTIVEDKGTDDYTVQELKTYITDSLASYTETAGEEKIQLESCTIKENVVRICLTYDSWEDYKEYNQMPCFYGSLEEATAAGYSFERSFLTSQGEAADASAILAEEGDRKIFILQEPVCVEVPGKIQYTTDNVTVSADQTAEIAGSASTNAAGQAVTVADAEAYIIFA